MRGWQPLRHLTLWCGSFASVNGLGKPVLHRLSDFSSFLQSTAHKRVLGFFRERERSIAVWTIELIAIANATGLLSEHPLAGAPKLDFVVYDHGGVEGWWIRLRARCFPRRCATKPSPQNPRSIIAHVEISGTAPVTPLPTPGLRII
jgi:hypothetical protein